MGQETRETLLILGSTLPWVVVAIGLVWSIATASLDRARADRTARGPRRARQVGWAAGDQLEETVGPATSRTRTSSARPTRRPMPAEVRSARA